LIFTNDYYNRKLGCSLIVKIAEMGGAWLFLLTFTLTFRNIKGKESEG
jgi:hypothetical protein